MSAVTDTDTKLSGRHDHQPPKKTGRPTAFSQEVADRICQHIADGGYATKLERFGLPSSPTLFRWLNENEAFREQYARAREKRAEHFADEMVEIADTCNDPAKGRLQVETRKWIASKLFPRMYGDKQQVEVQHTISETAARVLMELSERAKQKQAIERQTIDVTPVHSLAEGGDTAATSVGYDSTARVAHASDAPGLEPPASGSIVDPSLPETPPVRARKPRKK